jgi:hypothetical protein
MSLGTLLNVSMSGLSAYQKEDSKFKGIEYLFTEIVVEIFLCLWKHIEM